VDRPFELNLSNMARSFNTENKSLRAMYSAKSLGGPHRWTTMHLSRTVNTIVACKDPIWREYQKLFNEDHMERFAQTDITLQQLFARDWNSWLK
jgi:hypothetical protein